MAKYDDASWHYEGEYPADLPASNASNHIGMFLTWCIDNDLMSAEQLADYGFEIDEVKARRMTGAEFLISVCDEKLYDEDLNAIGNAFAASYYKYSNHTKFSERYANYIQDYTTTLISNTIDDLYRVEDTWENYNLLRPIIDQRFKEWQAFVTEY